MASRTAEVANAIRSAQPELAAILANSSTVSISLSAPLRVSLPESSIASASRSGGLGGTHRRRVAAAVRVHHEQMNRVAAHVEHAQSHALQPSGRASSTVALRDKQAPRRGRTGLPPRVGRVLRPGQPRASDRRRPDLAAVAGGRACSARRPARAPSRAAPTTAAVRTARSCPTTTTARNLDDAVKTADRRGLAVPRQGPGPQGLSRDGRVRRQAQPAHPKVQGRLHLPEPARVSPAASAARCTPRRSSSASNR